MIRHLALATLLLAPALQAQSVDQIYANHVQAMGGTKALKSIKSMRVTMKMVMGPGAEGTMTIERKLPGRIRTEMAIMGMNIVTAVNGKTGWTINPMAGSTEPTPMPEAQLKAVEEQGDQVLGPLTDYKERGATLESQGKEKVDGTDTLKLKLTTKDKKDMILWLDADSYLLVKLATQVEQQGQVINVTSKMGDYKAVGGIMVAHSIEAIPEGIPMTQKITIEKAEVNVPIEDSRFEMPKKAEPKPAEKTETKPAEKK